jgi:hypothetical protein
MSGILGMSSAGMQWYRVGNSMETYSREAAWKIIAGEQHGKL